MMMKNIIVNWAVLAASVALLVGCGSASNSESKEVVIEVPLTCADFIATEATAAEQSKCQAELGKLLFHDKSLSRDRSQSCATCHNPDKGFIDDRANDASRNSGGGIAASAGSLGDNQVAIGDRNAPTAAYAAFSPEFKQGTRARVQSQKTSGISDYDGFLGGQFWDGREADLAGQAGGPPLNPGEMNMPSKAAVVERIKENADYVENFERLYGAAIFADVDAAYNAMTDSIAAFETFDKNTFYPFDSKFDRSLSADYEYSPTAKASLGKARFFSSDLTCAACHQLRAIDSKGEIFSSFEYHNLGVPENTHLRAFNDAEGPDEGLLNNPNVTSPLQRGKFKVPTLRNIAVTAPYMHNGIFNELETVIMFYQHAKEKALNSKNGSAITAINNPETGLPWGDAEVESNIEEGLLAANQIDLDSDEVEAMVCFLMSLTDARYEHLLDQAKVSRCGL